VGIVARSFTQVGKQLDVAAEQGLQSRADRANDGARPYNDAAREAEVTAMR